MFFSYMHVFASRKIHGFEKNQLFQVSQAGSGHSGPSDIQMLYYFVGVLPCSSDICGSIAVGT